LQPAAAGSAVKEERTLEDLKVLKHNQRVGSVESWAQACELLKDYIHRSHCGEKCTPTLIANKNPMTGPKLARSSPAWSHRSRPTRSSRSVTACCASANIVR
jgi:hypothetical protein